MENYGNRTDVELLEHSLAGDEAAFQVLYERLKGGIFRYAFYMTNSRPAAEEVTQDAFIALLENAQQYREAKGSIAAFAFGITKNLVRRIERRERVYQPLPDDDANENSAENLASASESLPDELIRNEAVESVRAAIASLPEHYRQAVVLCDLCELPYSEAASRLGCAVGTVRSRLNRAHALLSQKLKITAASDAALRTTGTEGCLI